MRSDRARGLVALLAVLLIPIAGLVDIPQPGRIMDFLRTSLLGTAPALPEGQIGRIKTVSGTASIIRGTQHLPAEPGIPVYQEDMIETAPHGSIGITCIHD